MQDPKIITIEAELNTIKAAICKSILDLVQRGEKIDKIAEKGQVLLQQSKVLRRSIEKPWKCMCITFRKCW